MNPLCAVLLLTGKRLTVAGTAIDFDALYHELIEPAIHDAGLEPVRLEAEDSSVNRIEQFTLCQCAVADLTFADARDHYQLGMRHALWPGSTVHLCADGARLPVDASLNEALRYPVTDDGILQNAAEFRRALTAALIRARNATANPQTRAKHIYEFVEDFPGPAHTKTDVFRERVSYAPRWKERLAMARREGAAALRAIEQELAPINEVEAGVVIDLMLSYRAVRDWEGVIALVEKMARPLKRSVMAQEQFAFALNRAGRGEAAEAVLIALLARGGPSSETCALLGRVYKDRWEAALQRNDERRARDSLDQAIAAYLRGFEADWRDALPGINTITLMELKEPPDPRRAQLLPIVAYAVERRIAAGKPDYWDYAARLELAVLAKDEARAKGALAQALALVREVWEPETTARNLRLIADTHERRNEAGSWLKEIGDALARAAASHSP